ncbi:MAG: cell division protein SepF, partial [Oscillospiraceae bacterium]
MGVFNKLKNVFGVDEDDYDDEDEFEEEEEQAPVENAFKADFSQVKKEKNLSIASMPQLQVVLVKPEKFDDASGIADSLNAKKTVVLNLEATSKEVSRRLVDFLSGVAYA